MGRMPVIEADLKPVQIFGPFGGKLGHQLLGRNAFSFRLKHDRRPVRVVGADEMNFVTAQPLEPNPDVGLDVFHDVTNMERSVGVR